MMVAKWERDETTYQTHHPSKSWNVPPNYWGFSYILYLHKRKVRKHCLNTRVMPTQATFRVLLWDVARLFVLREMLQSSR